MTSSTAEIRLRQAPVAKLCADQPSGDCLRDRLGPIDDVEAPHGPVAVKVHRALAQAEDDGDLGRGLAATHPGEHVPLTACQVDMGGPYGRTLCAPKAVLDDHIQHFDIDWLSQAIVGPEPARSQLAVAVAAICQKDKWEHSIGRTGL